MSATNASAQGRSAAARRLAGAPGGLLLPRRPPPACLLVLVVAILGRPAAAAELAILKTGEQIEGQFEIENGKLAFRPAAGHGEVAVDQIQSLRFVPTERPRAAKPLWHVQLWAHQRVSAELLSFGAESANIRLFDEAAHEVPVVALWHLSRHRRPTPAERWAFEDGPPAGWKIDGEAFSVSPAQAAVGDHSLRLVATPARAVVTLEKPYGVCELTMRVRDLSAPEKGLPWGVEFRFGARTVRVGFSGADRPLAVSAPHGPELIVRRIDGTNTWREMRFLLRQTRMAILVDRQVLAAGPRTDEPLTALALEIEAGNPDGGESTVTAYVDEIVIARPNVGQNARHEQLETDVVTTASGDDVYGRIVKFGEAGLQIEGAFRPTMLPSDEIHEIGFRRRFAPIRTQTGTLARVALATDFMGRNSPVAGGDPDILEGRLVALDQGDVSDARLTLDHSWLGKISIPRQLIEQIDLMFTGTTIELDPTYHHLGNEPRADFRVIPAEGTRLDHSFELERLPAGRVHLVVKVVELESDKSAFASQIAAGHLQTRLFVNDHQLDTLNRFATRSGKLQTIRVPLAPDFLRVGPNRISIVQTPDADDPAEFDDVSIEGLRLEINGAP